jgi:hypothetical protein
MSYKYESTCAECYRYTITACPSDKFSLPTGLLAGTEISWRITDKFGNIWNGAGTIDSDGMISIDTESFEDGAFNPYAGFYIFEILSIGDPDAVICEGIEITICEVDYSCIAFDVAFITEVSE